MRKRIHLEVLALTYSLPFLHIIHYPRANFQNGNLFYSVTEITADPIPSTFTHTPIPDSCLIQMIRQMSNQTAKSILQIAPASENSFT